jgi:hypothetical protein
MKIFVFLCVSTILTGLNVNAKPAKALDEKGWKKIKIY